MESIANYQSIRCPEDMEYENAVEAEYNALIDEYDPDEYDGKPLSSTQKAWCRKEARRRIERYASESAYNEGENE